MSKIDSGLRTAREYDMNMSAEILRNLVSEVFKVSPREVILSGVMPQEFELEENHSSGSMYCHDKNHQVYGFEPAKGFVKVPGDMSGRSSNANGTQNNEKRTSFSHILEHHNNYIFFVVIEDNISSINDYCSEEHTVRLYKAPDFGAILASIEEADIARWKQWLQ